MVKVFVFLFIYAFSLLGAESQDDACPARGWVRHGSSCYLFVTHVFNDWTESEYFCSLLHSKLAEIETRDENNFLKMKASDEDDYENFGFWIGGIDAVYEGDWMWAKSMQKFNFTDWGTNFPDDYKSNEDCAHLLKRMSYQWNDEDCDHRMSFICEYE